jgi:hypothetical protein
MEVGVRLSVEWERNANGNEGKSRNGNRKDLKHRVQFAQFLQDAVSTFCCCFFFRM